MYNFLNKSRSSNKTQASSGNIFEEDDQKQRGEFEESPGPVFSGLAYCMASCGMILLNKVVLSVYDFNGGISLMLYQVMLVKLIRYHHLPYFLADILHDYTLALCVLCAK